MIKIRRGLTAIAAIAMMMSLVLVPNCRVYAAKGSTSGSMKVKSSEPVSGTITEETETTTNSDLDNMTKEELIAYTEQTMMASTEGDENGHCEFISEEDKIVINLWYNGLNEIVKLASDDDMYKPTWDYIVEGMGDMSKTLSDAFQKYDMDVYVNILNDENTEETLATVKNGEIVYNILDAAQ